MAGSGKTDREWVFEDRETPVGYKVLERRTGRIVGWIYRREDALAVADPVPPAQAEVHRRGEEL